MFDAVYGTRASLPKVTGYEVYKNTSLTRSDSESEKSDVFYYLVNYGNEEGFAILSSDRRTESVIAISNEGSIHKSDTISNKSLGWFLQNMLPKVDNSVTTSISTGPTVMDTTINEIAPYTKTIYSELLLTGFLSTFSQGAPYNSYCPVVDDYQTLVGCTALAVGTVMGYFECPSKHFDYTFDWDAMRSDQYHDSWALLFRVCGKSYNLSSKYTINGTSAQPSRLPNTFKWMGYTNTKYTNFSYLLTCNSLSELKPVIVSGWTGNPDMSLEGTIIGHTWVVDGAYSIDASGDSTSSDSNDSVSYYFHNVWGYGGANNGYFLYSNSNIS